MTTRSVELNRKMNQWLVNIQKAKKEQEERSRSPAAPVLNSQQQNVASTGTIDGGTSATAVVLQQSREVKQQGPSSPGVDAVKSLMLNKGRFAEGEQVRESVEIAGGEEDDMNFYRPTGAATSSVSIRDSRESEFFYRPTGATASTSAPSRRSGSLQDQSFYRPTDRVTTGATSRTSDTAINATDTAMRKSSAAVVAKKGLSVNSTKPGRYTEYEQAKEKEAEMKRAPAGDSPGVAREQDYNLVLPFEQPWKPNLRQTRRNSANRILNMQQREIFDKTSTSSAIATGIVAGLDGSSASPPASGELVSPPAAAGSGAAAALFYQPTAAPGTTSSVAGTLNSKEGVGIDVEQTKNDDVGDLRRSLADILLDVQHMRSSVDKRKEELSNHRQSQRAASRASSRRRSANDEEAERATSVVAVGARGYYSRKVETLFDRVDWAKLGLALNLSDWLGDFVMQSSERNRKNSVLTRLLSAFRTKLVKKLVFGTSTAPDPSASSSSSSKSLISLKNAAYEIVERAQVRMVLGEEEDLPGLMDEINLEEKFENYAAIGGSTSSSYFDYDRQKQNAMSRSVDFLSRYLFDCKEAVRPVLRVSLRALMMTRPFTNEELRKTMGKLQSSGDVPWISDELSKIAVDRATGILEMVRLHDIDGMTSPSPGGVSPPGKSAANMLQSRAEIRKFVPDFPERGEGGDATASNAGSLQYFEDYAAELKAAAEAVKADPKLQEQMCNSPTNVRGSYIETLREQLRNEQNLKEEKERKQSKLTLSAEDEQEALDAEVRKRSKNYEYRRSFEEKVAEFYLEKMHLREPVPRSASRSNYRSKSTERGGGGGGPLSTRSSKQSSAFGMNNPKSPPADTAELFGKFSLEDLLATKQVEDDEVLNLAAEDKIRFVSRFGLALVRGEKTGKMKQQQANEEANANTSSGGQGNQSQTTRRITTGIADELFDNFWNNPEQWAFLEKVRSAGADALQHMLQGFLVSVDLPEDIVDIQHSNELSKFFKKFQATMPRRGHSTEMLKKHFVNNRKFGTSQSPSTGNRNISKSRSPNRTANQKTLQDLSGSSKDFKNTDVRFQVLSPRRQNRFESREDDFEFSLRSATNKNILQRVQLPVKHGSSDSHPEIASQKLIDRIQQLRLEESKKIKIGSAHEASNERQVLAAEAQALLALATGGKEGGPRRALNKPSSSAVGNTSSPEKKKKESKPGAAARDLIARLRAQLKTSDGAAAGVKSSDPGNATRVQPDNDPKAIVDKSKALAGATKNEAAAAASTLAFHGDALTQEGPHPDTPSEDSLLSDEELQEDDEDLLDEIGTTKASPTAKRAAKQERRKKHLERNMQQITAKRDPNKPPTVLDTEVVFPKFPENQSKLEDDDEFYSHTRRKYKNRFGRDGTTFEQWLKEELGRTSARPGTGTRSTVSYNYTMKSSGNKKGARGPQAGNYVATTRTQPIISVPVPPEPPGALATTSDRELLEDEATSYNFYDEQYRIIPDPTSSGNGLGAGADSSTMTSQQFRTLRKKTTSSSVSSSAGFFPTQLQQVPPLMPMLKKTHGNSGQGQDVLSTDMKIPLLSLISEEPGSSASGGGQGEQLLSTTAAAAANLQRASTFGSLYPSGQIESVMSGDVAALHDVYDITYELEARIRARAAMKSNKISTEAAAGTSATLGVAAASTSSAPPLQPGSDEVAASSAQNQKSATEDHHEQDESEILGGSVDLNVTEPGSPLTPRLNRNGLLDSAVRRVVPFPGAVAPAGASSSPLAATQDIDEMLRQAQKRLREKGVGTNTSFEEELLQRVDPDHAHRSSIEDITSSEHQDIQEAQTQAHPLRAAALATAFGQKFQTPEALIDTMFSQRQEILERVRSEKKRQAEQVAQGQRVSRSSGAEGDGGEEDQDVDAEDRKPLAVGTDQKLFGQVGRILRDRALAKSVRELTAHLDLFEQ
ncbi:unnamed protein product [Amoebophrya sp. A120]|nr:unnamed protein product [Amoebophrya sp. A120]|eukprot:GSA120T00017232001.1